MKLLLDTCVWGGAKAELVRLGHDVTWSGEWATDPGDMEILEIARMEGESSSRLIRILANWLF